MKSLFGPCEDCGLDGEDIVCCSANVGHPKTQCVKCCDDRDSHKVSHINPILEDLIAMRLLISKPEHKKALNKEFPGLGVQLYDELESRLNSLESYLNYHLKLINKRK